MKLELQPIGAKIVKIVRSIQTREKELKICLYSKRLNMIKMNNNRTKKRLILTNYFKNIMILTVRMLSEVVKSKLVSIIQMYQKKTMV